MGTMINRRRTYRSSPIDYSKMYFTIESLEDGNVVSIINKNCDVLPTFYYSTDGGETWGSIKATKSQTKAVVTIDDGETVMFKCTLVFLATDWDKYNGFKCSKNYIVYGNAMSLIWGDNFVSNPEFAENSEQNLTSLFREDTNIIHAGNLILPAMTVCYNGYNGMFRDCSNLMSAPKLPATTFLIGGVNKNGANYASMFEGCINLEEAPELPATNLVCGCYYRMFCMSRTTKLTTPKMTKAPVLPALIVTERQDTYRPGAYEEMFKGNGNLIEVTCLAETFSTESCKDWLLNGSDTGTFKKAAVATWGTGTSGIPSGWTVEDYTE